MLPLPVPRAVIGQGKTLFIAAFVLISCNFTLLTAILFEL